MFTTWGPVRGDCGHVHRTFRGADMCIHLDARDCRSQGGYSDRDIYLIDCIEELQSYDVLRGPGRPADFSDR